MRKFVFKHGIMRLIVGEGSTCEWHDIGNVYGLAVSIRAIPLKLQFQ